MRPLPRHNRSRGDGRRLPLLARRSDDDDLIAGFRSPLDDLGVGVVVEAESSTATRTGLPSRRTQTCALRACARSADVAAARRRTGGHIAQRLIRHAQHVVALVGDDPDRRRHARLQHQVGIGDADHDVVGDDVLHRLRRLADLAHLALERAIGKGFDREGRRVVLLDAADVAFADIGIDLHLGEIGGDQEQGRRLEARRDRLAHGDVARHHGAVHRRNDIGVVQIDLRGVERGLVLLDRRLVEATCACAWS